MSRSEIAVRFCFFLGKKIVCAIAVHILIAN